MSAEQKIGCGILVMMTWGVLVYFGRTPVEPFIYALRDILVTLGIVHIALVDPKSSTVSQVPPIETEKKVS